MGFGSNVGDGLANLTAAMTLLAARGACVLRVSPVYLTEPWGGAPGGDFTNAVLEFERRGTAGEFLGMLQQVESALGRTRAQRSAPRPCDLDLLLWGSEVIETPELTVPHPRLVLRRFVLVPLCDLIADGVHPRLNKSFRELMDVCSDPLRVQRIAVL